MNSPRLPRFLPFLLMLMALCGCRTPTHETSSIESQIRALMDAQAREWNAGNLKGFMESYLDSDETRFAGGADVVRGRQRVLDRYQKKYGSNSAQMGKLQFTDLEVTVLTPQDVEVFGRWHLVIGDKPSEGLFTVLYRRTQVGWRIVHDHSS